VLLDEDLAALYGVETRRLNEQVRRNRARFPADFIFELTREEFNNLKSQFATSSWGGRRKLPLAFSEHGAIMTATILSTPQAIEMSVFIVRAFIRLRELSFAQQDLANRLDELEAKTEHQALKLDSFANITRKQLKEIFETLRQLATPNEPTKRPIGFVYPNETKQSEPPSGR
jgi:hypothetical protein